MNRNKTKLTKSFGWETSVYPIRGEVASKLSPYYRLYEACSNFKKDQHEVINGDMSKVNPDTVEGDVDNYWRTLYKCEKEMKDNPIAKAGFLKIIISHTRKSSEDFMTYLLKTFLRTLQPL